MDQSQTAPDEWRELAIDGYMGLVGPLLTRRIDGAKVYALRTGAQHRNAIGLVHGGVISGLIDQVVALEAWNASGRQPMVTVQIDVRFLGAARPGDLLEGRAQVRHRTQSLMFVDADLRCGEAAIATASAILKISRPEPA